MAPFVLKINPYALRALMKGAPVQADLKARADRAATAAGEGMEAHVQVQSARARASVVTATPRAMRREATEKALTRAIDAARG